MVTRKRREWVKLSVFLKGDSMDELMQKSIQLREKYQEHFDEPIPDSMNWWNPVNIAENQAELQAGMKQMEKDIGQAIRTDTKFEKSNPEFEIVY